MASTPEQPDRVPKATSRKTPTRLMALSSAAVVAVYGAGFWKTKAAADRLDAAEATRRSGEPSGRTGGPATTTPDRPEEATAAARPVRPSAPNVAFTLPTRPAPERQATPEPVAKAGAATAAPVATAAVSSAVATDSASAPTAAAPAISEPAAKPAEPTDAASTQTSAAPAVTHTIAAAAAPAEAQQPAAPALPKPSVQYKDGEYLGWGNCRHGDIQARVVVAGGRITSATVAQCLTRYSCNWIDPVVPQVVQRQSPNIDYVSGATQSVDAFYWAVIDALTKAK